MALTEEPMRNESTDDLDAGSDTTRPRPATNQIRKSTPDADPRRRWMEAGASDDLAFALAMLALTESGDG